MNIKIIQVPYDSGHRSLRMGAGPEHFVESGLATVLENDGFELEIECIEAQGLFLTEIDTAFELNRRLARRVLNASSQGYFPLVLSGNCNSALGTLAGIRQPNCGMIWFDAHGDFNTPETTESTFFDGMGMAMAAGHCWKKLMATIPGFSPLPDSNIIHAGGRDFDRAELELLKKSGVNLIQATEIQADCEALLPALNALRTRVDRLYLHIDLDVLDPALTPANTYAGRVPGGLTVEQLEAAIQLIAKRFQISAAGIASFDPQCDFNGETLQAGVRVIRSIVKATRPGS